MIFNNIFNTKKIYRILLLVVKIDLLEKSMIPGKKGYERIKWCFNNTLNDSFTFIIFFIDSGKINKYTFYWKSINLSHYWGIAFIGWTSIFAGISWNNASVRRDETTGQRPRTISTDSRTPDSPAKASSAEALIRFVHCAMGCAVVKAGGGVVAQVPAPRSSTT